MEIKGRFATAKVFARSIENEALLQIKAICDNELYEGQTIRIMPDVHAGKSALVGFTTRIGAKVNPWLIGVDIGCGLRTTHLGKTRLDCDKLDRFVRRHVPHGSDRHEDFDPSGIDEDFLRRVEGVCARIGADAPSHLRSLGTLGGGNHFLEVDRSEDGASWLVVHSGSRTFGHAVAEYHQKKATEHSRREGTSVRSPWLEGDDLAAYLEDLAVAQEFAAANRREMSLRILRHLRVDAGAEAFETVHNYIDLEAGVLRKGAVSARLGERIAVPLNMRDGVVLARGLGEEDWNWSAPHGAGRKMSRTKARETIDLDAYRRSMRGVWTSSVSERTLDEAPQAYKPSKEILELLPQTARIEQRLVPVWNFKGG